MAQKSLRTFLKGMAMTIDEFMRDIAPKMRPGWVAMDENKRWTWFLNEPKLDKNRKIWYGSSSWGFLDCYDLAPVDDWTQSLRRIGNE